MRWKWAGRIDSGGDAGGERDRHDEQDGDEREQGRMADAFAHHIDHRFLQHQRIAEIADSGCRADRSGPGRSPDRPADFPRAR